MTLGDDIVIHRDMTLGDDIVIHRDMTLGDDIVIHRDMTLGDDIVIHRDMTLGDDIVIHRDMTLGDDIVSATISQAMMLHHPKVTTRDLYPVLSQGCSCWTSTTRPHANRFGPLPPELSRFHIIRTQS